jgi:hypothetical protein
MNEELLLARIDKNHYALTINGYKHTLTIVELCRLGCLLARAERDSLMEEEGALPIKYPKEYQLEKLA